MGAVRYPVFVNYQPISLAELAPRWFPAATATARGRLAPPASSAGLADLDRALVREPAVVVLVMHDVAPLPKPSGQPV
jgi:hypothetical protein